MPTAQQVHPPLLWPFAGPLNSISTVLHARQFPPCLWHNTLITPTKYETTLYLLQIKKIARLEAQLLHNWQLQKMLLHLATLLT